MSEGSLSLGLGCVLLISLGAPYSIWMVGFFIGVGISYAVDAVWFFGKGHYILNG